MYERLNRLDTLISEEIERGYIVGASAAVIHKGETVYRSDLGYSDREKGVKMAEDTIFRLFSMTKPVTAAAAMILMEQGKILPEYPVKWFLPTFENPQVLDENGLRPADRDVLISDLLNMTSGICYPDCNPAGMKMGELWGKVADLQSRGEYNGTTREFALEMGKIPLAFTPGDRWMYGASADVLGAVIEEASGMSLSDFMKKEIFDPLGMDDTGFMIEEPKYSRLAQIYDWSEEEHRLLPFGRFHLCLTDYRTMPNFLSGGAGLTSTVKDYGRFAQMLVNGGELDGVRILGRKTVDFMTENHLNARQLSALDWYSMRGHGYGNFMRVLLDRTAAGSNGSIGEFGWDGWTGNAVFMDRSEQLVFLYFIQKTNTGMTDFTHKLKNVVYSAI